MVLYLRVFKITEFRIQQYDQWDRVKQIIKQFNKSYSTQLKRKKIRV